MVNPESDLPLPDARATMQQRVYAHIKAMITEGRIRPGERLLEVHVASACGVSRSPARRALQALCDDKFVRAALGRGYVVTGRRASVGDTDLASITALPLMPVPRWQRIHEEMEAQICIGVVYQAMRITEERVAEHFEVSRTVARDALARLHSAGLVDKDRQGRWVAPRMTPTVIHSLYELRWLLEPSALQQSARAIPRAWVQAARDRMQHALTDIPALGSDLHISLENELHVDLLKACPNQELLRVLERARPLLVSNPHRLNYCVGEPTAHLVGSLREHLDVLDLWLAGDIEAAATALREHLRNSCGFWLDAWDKVENKPTPILPTYLTPLE